MHLSFVGLWGALHCAAASCRHICATPCLRFFAAPETGVPDRGRGWGVARQCSQTCTNSHLLESRWGDIACWITKDSRSRKNCGFMRRVVSRQDGPQSWDPESPLRSMVSLCTKTRRVGQQKRLWCGNVSRVYLLPMLGALAWLRVLCVDAGRRAKATSRTCRRTAPA